MNDRFKIAFPSLLAAILLAGFLGACNTVEGVGEDIEDLGDAIEDAADD